jgi:hypothetical protein
MWTTADPRYVTCANCQRWLKHHAEPQPPPAPDVPLNVAYRGSKRRFGLRLLTP